MILSSELFNLERSPEGQEAVRQVADGRVQGSLEHVGEVHVRQPHPLHAHILAVQP